MDKLNTNNKHWGDLDLISASIQIHMATQADNYRWVWEDSISFVLFYLVTVLELEAENPRMQKDSEIITQPWTNDILLYYKESSLGYEDNYHWQF